MMNTTVIRKAVVAAGGNAVLAKTIGVQPSLVSQWVTGRRPVAPRWSIAIEGASGGAVTRYELHPEIYGPAPVEKVA